MEKFYVTKRVPLLVSGVIVITLCWLALSGTFGMRKAHAAEIPTPPNQELAALRTEVDRLKGIVPDQSHAMDTRHGHLSRQPRLHRHGPNQRDQHRAGRQP